MNEIFMKTKDSFLANEYPNVEFVDLDHILQGYEGVVYELKETKRKLRELEENIRDNYIQRPMSDYTGDSIDDRY